jgi:hypothetical protein
MGQGAPLIGQVDSFRFCEKSLFFCLKRGNE